MKSLPTSTILLILTLLACPASIAEKLFYEQPSFDFLEANIIDLDAMILHNMSTHQKIEEERNRVNIILTRGLVYPQYVETVIKKFKSYGPMGKQAVIDALVHLKGKAGLTLLNLPPETKASKLMTLEDLEKLALPRIDTGHPDSIITKARRYLLSALGFKVPDLSVHSPIIKVSLEIKKLFSAFALTGKDKYIEQVLTYLANEPLLIRAMGADEVGLEKALGNLQEFWPILRHSSDCKVLFLKELAKENNAYSFNRLDNYRYTLSMVQYFYDHFESFKAKLDNIVVRRPELNPFNITERYFENEKDSAKP